MADISQTAANVAIGGQSVKTEIVQYGEAVTQGMTLYQSTADSKYYKTDADAEATAKCSAIALTPGASDAYGLVAKPSTTPGKSLINLGATLTVGAVYVVSVNPGGIAPLADLGSGDFVTIIGVATTTALLDFQVVVSNTAEA